ncbi:MAG TPA: PGPGW domain-containing protein [Candidatus Dormibacteraeota bacterium]|nr:PGPGW domain-containing protein [Candidatus Dormibacteraeota bacterium]
MANFIQELKADWRHFAATRPGDRFRAHHRRVQDRASSAASIARVAVGVLLSSAGFVLLFLPGPAWLLILLGLAMFAGEWEWLARSLDHLELAARSRGRRLRTWWRRDTVAAHSR